MFIFVVDSLADTCKCGDHSFLHRVERRDIGIDIYESDIEHIVGQGVGEYMLVESVSFAHKSFDMVAFDGTFEAFFRDASEYLAMYMRVGRNG